MINKIHMKLDEKLIEEYKSVIGNSDPNKIFVLLRKYLKFIENDDEDFQRFQHRQ